MKKKLLTVLLVAVIAIVGVCIINTLQTREKTVEVLNIEKPAVLITYTNRYKNLENGSVTVVNGIKNQSEKTIKTLRIELQQFDSLATVKDRQHYTVDVNLKPNESTNISSDFVEKEKNKGMLISPIIREIVVGE